MSLVVVPCDICGSDQFTPVYPGTITDPNASPALYYSSSRTRAGYLPIVRCQTCGLLQTNPRDDAATLQQVYASLADPVYDAEDVNRRRTARAYLALIKRHAPHVGTLLDVGCATGMFASEAQHVGWQVTGLEASTWALRRARQLTAAVTWVNQSLEQAHFPPASFDIITLWDVLEHVASPTATLQRLHQWLKPGGYFFLNLPDSGSWVARGLGPRWVLLLREHLWYFDANTMRQVLAKTGFRLVQQQPNWVRFSLANISGRIGQYPGVLGVVGRRLSTITGLKAITLTFPMGEMNVVAQRL